MLLVASETGHVYTFATEKLQPMITSEEGKNLIQSCLSYGGGTETSGNGVGAGGDNGVQMGDTTSAGAAAFAMSSDASRISIDNFKPFDYYGDEEEDEEDDDEDEEDEEDEEESGEVTGSGNRPLIEEGDQDDDSSDLIDNHSNV